TLSHPHGQIYAYPFVPPVIGREAAMMEAHLERTSECLLCTLARDEREDGRRLLDRNDRWSAFVPPFARYPYEVHLVATRHCGTLPELSASERFDLARILHATVRAYDRLFERPFPYFMAIHQRPAGADPRAYSLHVEFYPPLRTATKLKYLAGSEAGAGMFINDTLAEEKAAELRSVW
ncbi:MAG: galactose-1-phosphate uridylyltransferase, partial [Candidatus Eremiobacteraeota bacterium]|nr:galactose-1-phosphate uridylyltransferase [Candidatus Eremiobacteraeota bacterium]